MSATAAPPARAVEFHPSASPQVLTGKPPWRIRYAVELDSGPAPETIEMNFDSWPAEITGAASVTNEATVDVFRGGRIGCPTAAPPNLLWRPPVGYEQDLLALPPNSATIVSLSFVLDHYPRLTDTFGETFNANVVTADGTRTALPPIDIAGPTVAVPYTLSLGLGFPGTPGSLHKPGQRLRLVGRADPRVAGQVAEFRYTARGHRRTSRSIGRGRIGGDGSFSSSWTLPRPGIYDVSVRYQSQDSRFVTSAGECEVPVVVRR
jgi:hypothetical protein